MTQTNANAAMNDPYEKKRAIAWMYGHLRRFPYLAALFFLSVVISVFAQTLSTVYLGNVFETLQSDTGKAFFVKSVLLVFGLLVGGALTQWVSSLSILTLRLKMEKAIRNEIYAAFLSKKQDYMNTVRTGDLLAIGTNELRNISVMFQPGLNMTLRSILFYLMPLTIIFASYSWTMWLLPVSATFISILLLIRYARNITNTTSQAREQFGKLNSDLNETVEGIEVVKSNLQEKREMIKFDQNVSTYADRVWARALFESKYLPTLVFHLFFTAAFLHCLLLYRVSELTMGELITYLVLFLAIGSPVGNAEITFGFIGMGLASAVRILKAIQDGATGRSNIPEVRPDSAIKGTIAFRGVSFEISSGRKVLKDMTFTARAGEMVAIVGATGSGKSLLTKLVNRSFEATEGTIEIDGIDIKKWDVNALRTQIGMIEQDVFLFSWTVRENIAFANPDLTDDDIKYYARLACADSFIEKLEQGYDTRIGERGIQLSGGQRQRIAMARAFASDPKILVLDDSTSGLDSGTEQEIIKAIRQVSQGRTTLLITNRLPLIQQAHHIILLNKGQIAAQGNHSELLSHSALYRDLFAQKEVT